MFFATDVHYRQAGAVAAAVGFWKSTDGEATRQLTRWVDSVEPYEPGRFYLRELPCLVAVLEDAAKLEAIDLVVVDGHAWLADGVPGLGAHLWRALGERIPVFGVAKAAYAGGSAVPVLRGRSRRPLHVSACGVPVHEAVDFVQSMHGPNRLPTLLGEVDALSRRRIG